MSSWVARNGVAYFEGKPRIIKKMINLIILLGKYHIHKSKFSKSLPKSSTFLIGIKYYTDSLKLTRSKKGQNCQTDADVFFNH